MIKAVFFILILVALAFGFSHIAETSGHFAMTLNNHTYEASLVVALLIFAAIIMFFLILVAILKLILRSPKLAIRASRERKKRKGFEAISQGLLSVTAGDFKSAERHARDALRFMPDEPLSLLLTAQTHQLGSNSHGAEKAFRAMLEAPGTKLIGLKGLHREAERRNDLEAASQIASDAVKIAPSTGWAAASLLKGELARKDYENALKSVDRQLIARLIDKTIAKRWRGLLLTALAIEKNDKNLILEALGFLPDFAPTVAFASSKMHEAGDTKKAIRLIESAWKKSPHPLLATSFKALIAEENAENRYKKIATLAKLNENDINSCVFKAKAAIEANLFEEARQVLQAYISEPTRQICMLMSEIALKENNDNGKAKEWMSKALRAKSDAAWIGDNITLQEWQVASPFTHEIDGVNWQDGAENIIMLEMQEKQTDIQPEIRTEILTIEQPKHVKTQIDEVLLALPHPPDDPGPKQPGKAIIY